MSKLLYKSLQLLCTSIFALQRLLHQIDQSRKDCMGVEKGHLRRARCSCTALGVARAGKFCMSVRACTWPDTSKHGTVRATMTSRKEERRFSKFLFSL